MTTGTTTLLKTRRPETLREARTFETNAAHYRALGLCPACAGQTAYGHQLGFSLIEQPCRVCRAAVAVLPKAEANGWRSQSSSTSATWRKTGTPTLTTAPDGPETPGSAVVVAHGLFCEAGEAA